MNNHPVFRISDAGKCIRAIGAKMLKYEPIPESEAAQRIMRESKRHEDWVVQDLEEEGYTIEWQGLCPLCKDREGIHVELEHDLFKLVGHLDGRIQRSDIGRRVLEIKALGRFQFQKAKEEGLLAIYPEYGPQLACYMAADGRDGLWVIKCRDTGEKWLLLQERQDITPTLDRLAWLTVCLDQNKLPDGTPYGYDECRWCGFRYFCTVEQPALEEAYTQEELPDLLAAATMWREGRDLETQGKQMQEKAKTTFVIHAKETGIHKFAVEDLSVSYTGLKRREFFDEEILRQLVADDVLQKALRRSRPWEDIRVRPIDLKRQSRT